MPTNHPILSTLRAAARPAALLLTVLAFLAAAGFGANAFDPPRASAQPVLAADGSCQPDPVRPGEAVLITCTVNLTNSGDTAATNLIANVAPVSGCNAPIPTFIDRTRDGELLPLGSLQLSYDLGDLAAGATGESITRLAVVNGGSGPTGGAIHIYSADSPTVSADITLCWEVSADADAPPTNLHVTKTFVGGGPSLPPPMPISPPMPVSPPSDVSGPGGVTIEPVPIDPVAAPIGPGEAQYEIVVANVSGVEMTDISLLDHEVGDAVLVSAEPPATGTDAIGRPTWDLGGLSPGEEVRILTTYGPPPGGNCSYASDLAIVTATPAGGEPEEYVAFGEYSSPVGPCEFPSYCWFYPPDNGFPTNAPCDFEVCWANSPDGSGFRAVYDCDPSTDYCWFLPPGQGFTALRGCAEDVCWFSYGSSMFEEYFFDVPCDFEFCQYTAPDGSQSYRDSCDFPLCWSIPTDGAAWQVVYGCGQFDPGGLCWYTPPNDQEPVLRSCGQDLCWLSFGEGDYLYDIPCDLEFCQYTAPDGTTSYQDQCDFPLCWSSAPGDGYWAPVYGCGEFDDLCWFTPPGDGGGMSQLSSCSYPLQFAINPPEGALDFGYPQVVYGDGDWCWPVPPDGGTFYTFIVGCSEIESITWFFPPNGGPAFPSYGQTEACWQPLPPDISLPPGAEPLPPDLLIPGPCAADEEPKAGVPSDSVPAEVADGVSTEAIIVEGTVQPKDPLRSINVENAEILEGTVERLDPLRSPEVLPAEIFPTERIEQESPEGFPPDQGGPGEPSLPTTGPAPGGPVPTPTAVPDQGSPRPDGEVRTVPDLLGFPKDTGPDVESLPDAGASAQADNGESWPWLLVTALSLGALLLASAALRVRERRNL